LVTHGQKVQGVKEEREKGASMKDPRSYHVGDSDYSDYKIQPYDIWDEYNLDPWSADIVKRILRTKYVEGMTMAESRIEDLRKIQHICEYLINKLTNETNFSRDQIQPDGGGD